MFSEKRDTSSQESPSESPRSHDANPSFHSCIPLNESTAMEYTSSYGDSLPSADLMNTQTSMSPTFLQKEFITKGLTSFPLAVHIPSALQLTCDCGEALGFHTNQLRHMTADPVHLRFDQSLQAIQAALSVGRIFLQCTGCHKDNPSLLLSVSVLDLTLQLFEYWMSYEFAAGVERLVWPGPVGYGEYEMCPEETRRVQRFLLQGRLRQAQEVLGLLKETVELSGSGGIDGGWLRQLIEGYETSMEAFLQSLGGCICSNP
ncbi:hypothetical protein EYZ11_001532 [Aspergillus tanneri]|uniref:Uncharacterized protein n=1 Tax=Aspergillus tanneri TaxID=1220188 RepID=A0A4S3JUC5_9EURO|nr:hypothetical protein EYZ11_001532 [Aspergillus tanneri]